MSVRHAKNAAGPDIPGYEVVFSDWNADHVGSPVLAEVLAEGNDPGGTPIQAAADVGYLGASVSINPGDSGTLLGGAVTFAAGASAAGHQGGFLVTSGGDDDAGRGGRATLYGGEAASGSGGEGGEAILSGGNGDGTAAARVSAYGGTAAANGKIAITTDNSQGNAADVLTADGAGAATWQPGVTADEKAALDAAPTPLTALNPVASVADLPLTVRIAAGVPSGAPGAGESWIALDTTAVTGGVYGWDGAAWEKAGP